MSELVRCGFGLGNRVAAMANGLSRWPAIRFVWRDSAHCPATHADVFPGGVEGVEFVTDFPPASASRWDGQRCQFWEAAGDRAAATAAYARIMAAMAVAAPVDLPRVAIIARFHREPDADIAAIAREAADHAGGSPVFILADSRRDDLAAALNHHGLGVILPQCPPLASDMVRRREDVRSFIADWLTAGSAGHLITHGETSLAFPFLRSHLTN